MSNKLIGKFYEKRGDDFFTINVSPDGDVVEITQRDAIRLTYPSINFWAESAPEMIRLIGKAAGLSVEWEYAVEQTHVKSGRKNLVSGLRTWTPNKEYAVALCRENTSGDYIDLDSFGEPVYSFRVVRREKPKPYEVLVD